MQIDDLWPAAVKLYESVKYFIAGAIGASIVAYYLRDKLNTKTEFVIFVLSGAFIAHYLTQLTVFVIGRFGWALETSNIGSIGFLLGAFGGLIFQQIVSYIVSGAWKEISFRKYIIEAIKDAWNSKGKK
ncbi:putative holin [Acinetobacter phage vB_AbaP_Alexa]|nr:putative holin [Acinetobacter phage vB_AbaP_Alexa]